MSVPRKRIAVAVVLASSWCAAAAALASDQPGVTVPAAGRIPRAAVAAMYVWTQDYQFLPISFGDPRTGAPTAFTFPLSLEGLQCRRSNVEATAYISGPPTLVLPKR